MNSIALNASALGEALAARAAGGNQISEVFFVACGGSLVDLYPARFFLASEGRRALRGERAVGRAGSLAANHRQEGQPVLRAPPHDDHELRPGADGPDRGLFTALDNLIAEKRVPVMIAISIGNGSGDAQGSQRGLEYDTMSGLYAQFVETEVLPLVEKQYNVKLTNDPEGRATMGCSSGGSAAMAMAWYRTDLYHRVLSYSGTFVYQQWPYNAETPHGAWNFHETLIPNSPKKPLRIWMHVSDRDNLNTRDNYHDWVLANENMAKVLAAKGYPYQFVFAKNASHCDRAVKAQTLPLALEYVWRGYSKR